MASTKPVCENGLTGDDGLTGEDSGEGTGEREVEREAELSEFGGEGER